MDQGELFPPKPPEPPKPTPSKPENRAKELPESFGTAAENRAIVKASIDKTQKHTTDDWKKFALELMYRLLLLTRTFVIDDLWAEMNLVRKGKSQVMQGKVPEPEPNHSVAGWLVQEACKRGWMEKSTSFHHSERKAAHKKIQVVWISLIHRGI